MKEPQADSVEEVLCLRCGVHPTNQRKALQQRGLCCNKCPDHGPWCTMHEARQVKEEVRVVPAAGDEDITAPAVPKVAKKRVRAVDVRTLAVRALMKEMHGNGDFDDVQAQHPDWQQLQKNASSKRWLEYHRLAREALNRMLRESYGAEHMVELAGRPRREAKPRAAAKAAGKSGNAVEPAEKVAKRAAPKATTKARKKMKKEDEQLLERKIEYAEELLCEDAD